MKTLTVFTAAWLAATAMAAAQDSPRTPLARGDAQVVIGWQNLHNKQASARSYNDWVNGIFYAGAGAGWYWTDHLKTQVDVGVGSEGHQYRYGYTTAGAQSTTTSSRLAIRRQQVAVGQHYQFFRNQWFHPHVGAGIDIARETTREEFSPTVVFDSATRTSREIVPARTEAATHRTIARPFAEAGLKAYMTRRAFFTADTRLMYRNGLDEVLLRFGFGLDF